MNTPNTSCEAQGSCSATYLIAGMAAGAALGAVAMFFCDPNRGKVRRAKIVDGATSAVKRTTHDAAGKAEDLFNRAKGVVAKTGAVFNFEGTVDDQLITDRVRSLMGHVIRHPHAVESEVTEGKVTLRGTLPENERRRLVEEVGRVPGVKSVQDCLACAVPA